MFLWLKPWTKKHPTCEGSGVERIIGNPNGKILDDEDIFLKKNRKYCCGFVRHFRRIISDLSLFSAANVPSEDSLFRMNKGVPTVQQIFVYIFFDIYKFFDRKFQIACKRTVISIPPTGCLYT